MYDKKNQQKSIKYNIFINKFKYIIYYSFDKPLVFDLKKYVKNWKSVSVLKIKKTNYINIGDKRQKLEKNLNMAGYFFLCGSNYIIEILQLYFESYLNNKLKNMFLLDLLKNRISLLNSTFIKVFFSINKIKSFYYLIFNLIFFFSNMIQIFKNFLNSILNYIIIIKLVLF